MPSSAKAFEVGGVDAATFEALDSTYARDDSHVYINGAVLPDADAASFVLLPRPGFSKDRDHVYQHDRVLSDDPAHFELLDGELAKDSRVVYWSDGSVLSEDPAPFAIISDADHYLHTRDDRPRKWQPRPRRRSFDIPSAANAYARDNNRGSYFDRPISVADLSSFRPLDGPYASDSSRVYWMGKAIDGASPNTFRVLNANFECSADSNRAYYRRTAIAGADPHTFPPEKAVTNCSDTSISFAE
jgi:hypothetical protein